MTPDVAEAPQPRENDPTHDTHRKLGGFLLVSSLIALYASIVLTVDKITLLEAKASGETAILGCDLNPWVSCSSVVASDQATAFFGVPNPLWGIAGFTAVAVLGALLLSGSRLPGWIWAALQLGVTAGVAFVTWLQYEAIYDIQRLCPWCMVVWACMIPMFVLVTARNLNWKPLKDWTGLVIALWVLAVVGAIWFQFGTKVFGV